jgi:hypothetical protein
MTKYVIRRHRDGQYWGGQFPTFEAWVSEPHAARLFESMTDANYTAIVECHEPIAAWTAIPIAVPDLSTETHANNERIVLAATERALRS